MTLYPIYDADEIKYQVKEYRMTQTHQSIESLQYHPTYYGIFLFQILSLSSMVAK